MLNRTNVLTFVVLLIILLMALGVTWFFVLKAPGVSKEAPINSALGTLEGGQRFTDIEGNQVLLDTDFGKTIVVFVWASWCPSCAEDLQNMNVIAADFTSAAVKVIAINRAENKFTAQRFLSSLPDLENIEVVLDPDDTFFNTLEGYAMPEAVVYNKKGEILLHQRGFMNLDEIRYVISEEE